MPKHSKPRAGSLQYWPRKRSRKFLPRVNYSVINSDKKLLGFIAYKVGMASCFVKDNTENSLSQNKDIVLASTVVETPPMKIFSVRFYKNGRVKQDIIVSSDKELKKKVKLPKKIKKEDLEKVKDYDDVSILAYSLVKNTGIKKKPDLTEIGLSGSKEEKLKWVKENLNKEILASDYFNENDLVDIRGLTKGKGIQGPVKRFGIKLRDHKSEKGRRKVGSIGPWHPSHVTFRIPMAGQTGMQTRIQYNNNILKMGKAENKLGEWKRYGKIKTGYMVIKGSLQGSKKRPLLLTMPLRPSKKQTKQKYQFIKLE